MLDLKPFHNRKREVATNRRSDPIRRLCGDDTREDRVQMCRCLDFRNIRIGPRTRTVNSLNWITLSGMNFRWTKRHLTVTQQVWTDCAVKVQCYLILVRQGSEDTREHKKNKKWDESIWRPFQKRGAWELSSLLLKGQVCVCVCARICRHTRYDISSAQLQTLQQCKSITDAPRGLRAGRWCDTLTPHFLYCLIVFYT